MLLELTDDGSVFHFLAMLVLPYLQDIRLVGR